MAIALLTLLLQQATKTSIVMCWRWAAKASDPRFETKLWVCPSYMPMTEMS